VNWLWCVSKSDGLSLPIQNIEVSSSTLLSFFRPCGSTILSFFRLCGEQFCLLCWAPREWCWKKCASGVVLKKNGATGEVALRQLGRRTKTSEILHQLQNVLLYKIRQNSRTTLFLLLTNRAGQRYNILPRELFCCRSDSSSFLN
jgi:hypothetical protein